MSTSYGLTIEFSGNLKLQKCIIFPSQDTNYLHKWLVHFLTCLLVLWLFLFFLQKFRDLCNPRTGWPTLISILWKWDSKLTKLAGHGECRLARFHPISNFLSNGINHFTRLFHQTGYLFTWEAHSIQSALYSAFFAYSGMLFWIKYWN